MTTATSQEAHAVATEPGEVRWTREGFASLRRPTGATSSTGDCLALAEERGTVCHGFLRVRAYVRGPLYGGSRADGRICVPAGCGTLLSRAVAETGTPLKVPGRAAA